MSSSDYNFYEPDLSRHCLLQSGYCKPKTEVPSAVTTRSPDNEEDPQNQKGGRIVFQEERFNIQALFFSLSIVRRLTTLPPMYSLKNHLMLIVELLGIRILVLRFKIKTLLLFNIRKKLKNRYKSQKLVLTYYQWPLPAKFTSTRCSQQKGRSAIDQKRLIFHI